MRRLICKLFGHKWRCRYRLTGVKNLYQCTRCHKYKAMRYYNHANHQ